MYGQEIILEDIKTGVKQKFRNQSDAARYLNVHRQVVSNACRDTVRGYKVYKQDIINKKK